jgi:hypothetical protein
MGLKRQWIGIDISPTACRVMAKRLRDVCALPESEPLWRAGRGFVVRDLPGNLECADMSALSKRRHVAALHSAVGAASL